MCVLANTIFEILRLRLVGIQCLKIRYAQLSMLTLHYVRKIHVCKLFLRASQRLFHIIFGCTREIITTDNVSTVGENTERYIGSDFLAPSTASRGFGATQFLKNPH